MSDHVCPWWGGYFIDNPLRRLVHNPRRLLGEYVREGMTVMDVGCGMGFFSIAMAKMVGPTGRVIAADIQPQMLRALERRARSAGVSERITTHLCEPDRLGVEQAADFVLAFAMIHEAPDRRRLLEEVAGCLKPAGRLFIAEPIGHVPQEDFQRTLDIADSVGLAVTGRPAVRLSRAAVLIKREGQP